MYTSRRELWRFGRRVEPCCSGPGGVRYGGHRRAAAAGVAADTAAAAGVAATIVKAHRASAVWTMPMCGGRIIIFLYSSAQWWWWCTVLSRAILAAAHTIGGQCRGKPFDDHDARTLPPEKIPRASVLEAAIIVIDNPLDDT